MSQIRQDIVTCVKNEFLSLSQSILFLHVISSKSVSLQQPRDALEGVTTLIVCKEIVINSSLLGFLTEKITETANLKDFNLPLTAHSLVSIKQLISGKA